MVAVCPRNVGGLPSTVKRLIQRVVDSAQQSNGALTRFIFSAEYLPGLWSTGSQLDKSNAPSRSKAPIMLLRAIILVSIRSPHTFRTFSKARMTFYDSRRFRAIDRKNNGLALTN